MGVHITPWGAGQQAALDYLTRYAFRIAITNNRILSVTDAPVKGAQTLTRWGALIRGFRLSFGMIDQGARMVSGTL